MNAGGESPDSLPVSVSACGGALPGGWSDQDIGSVAQAGSAASCSSSFIVQASGNDIWGSADAFHFASTSLAGDGSLVARVVAVQNTDPWAKAGLMMRNDTTAGSIFADLFVTPGNGVSFQWRATANGGCNSTTVGGITAPVWLKLTRSGTNFMGYYGMDGLHWTLVASNGINMASSVRAGLALTAHNNSALTVAGFDGVATAAPVTPSNLSAFGGNGWVSLSWTGTPAAVSYNVKRSAVTGGPYTTIAGPAIANYFDSPRTNWTTSYYLVSSVNGLGESANSSEVAATPRPPPSVSVGSSGGQTVMSWPLWATGYTTYSASNLLAPVQWQLVTNTPQIGPRGFNLLLPTASDQQFFRLGSP
jgi:hypothetical protein